MMAPLTRPLGALLMRSNGAHKTCWGLLMRSGVSARSLASSATTAKLFGSLRAPIIGAPLFIVSTPELVIAQCKVCAT